MSANQDAAFYVYENYGLSSSEMVSSKDGTYLVYSNYGLSSAELVPLKEGFSYIYENLGINQTDYLRMTVDRRAIGWGVSPYKNETVLVLLTDIGVGDVYENITT